MYNHLRESNKQQINTKTKKNAGPRVINQPVHGSMHYRFGDVGQHFGPENRCV